MEIYVKKWNICLEIIMMVSLPIFGKIFIDGKEVAVDSLSPVMQKKINGLTHNFGENIVITLLKDEPRIFEIRNFDEKINRKYATIIKELEGLKINTHDSISIDQGWKKWQTFGKNIAREAGYPEDPLFSLKMDKVSIPEKRQMGKNSANGFRFNEFYNGIPIDEAYVYGSLKEDRLSSLWFQTFSNMSPKINGISPVYSFAEALKKFLNGGTLQKKIQVPTGILCYCSLKKEKILTLELCWKMEIDCAIVYISAVSGTIIWKHGQYS